MQTVRLGSICVLVGLPLAAAADLAPPRLRNASRDPSAEAAAAKQRDTCAPSYEQSPGPRGTLITRRAIAYDLMLGSAEVTPPEARQPLRALVDRAYKAVRPCLPPDAALQPPERLIVKLHLSVTGAKVSTVVALAMDKRVDARCVEGVFLQQAVPGLALPMARLGVDVTLAPFCMISHAIEHQDGIAESRSSGFGVGARRHLMPPPETPSPAAAHPPSAK